ncbi:hypothetical protein GCM10007315_24260 [Gemmobacter tilapiae]|uniref:Uncharacterized protein n=2 Tax=Neogemmobacter tilapiae TaxID=875041 RepID=A0A918TS25_9RHOB|nr:hypothetical protein GCM10007315_24260 [Gemmobacter tilapiae]
MIYPDDRGFWMGRADWIGVFLRSDPLMEHVVFEISAGFSNFDEFVAGQIESFFPNIGVSHPKYDIPGYEVRRNKDIGFEEYFFVSQNDPIGHVVICSNPDANGIFISCHVYARYAPDVSILLESDILRPIPGLSSWEAPSWEETWPTFLPIANRSREIAHCLDVTDLIAAGITPDQTPPKDPTKFLEECREGLTN